MAVLLTSFVQHSLVNSHEYGRVTSIAEDLLAHLNQSSVAALIESANAPGKSSALVQNTFLAHARALGFVDESKGLFDAYEGSAVRPDYYLPIDDTGILLEVERGKTTINNMDFLDFWKCHLCHHANYLFLMVPQQLRQNDTMRPRNEYNAVVKRLGEPPRRVRRLSSLRIRRSLGPGGERSEPARPRRV